MHHALDREHSLSRKFLQLTNGKLVQAELALRFWKEHNNFYVWAPIPLFAERADYRCLELAIIQEWQPRLAILSFASFSTLAKAFSRNLPEHQCTVWPCHTLATGQTQIHSTGGQRHLGLGSNRLELWTIIHASGLWDQTLRPDSNKLKCFDPARVVSPWAIHYMGRPTTFRSPIAHCPSRPSMPPFDGRGKPAPLASALRAPSSLSPNLQKTFKQFLRKWLLQVLAHQVPCHRPSFKTVFVKHASVLDQLCNHKQAITQWSMNSSTQCCCKLWSNYKKAAINPTNPHWVLSGPLLAGLLPEDLTVIAEGSLLNEVCPSKKDYHSTLQGRRSPTPCRLHPGQKQKSVPKPSSHHVFCGLTLSTNAQYLGQIYFFNSFQWRAQATSLPEMFTPYLHSCKQLPSTATSSSSTKTLLASSPALIKRGSSEHGICCWISFAHI